MLSSQAKCGNHRPHLAGAYFEYIIAVLWAMSSSPAKLSAVALNYIAITSLVIEIMQKNHIIRVIIEKNASTTTLILLV